MDIILDSQTSTPASSSTNKTMKIKAASVPAMPVLSDEALLKQQLSAPSYFHSLKENDAPPFRKPEEEPWPHLMIGAIMGEEEAVAMIAAAGADKHNGLKRFLGNFLVEKKIIANYDVSERDFLISLLMETIDYAAQLDFDAFKLGLLITLYLNTHLYFKWYYWQSPKAVWEYFKELMIRHTIEDSPSGEEVFGPEECYDIVSHFHTVYLSNLPLIHIVTFGSHRLKLQWPFRMK